MLLEMPNCWYYTGNIVSQSLGSLNPPILTPKSDQKATFMQKRRIKPTNLVKTVYDHDSDVTCDSHVVMVQNFESSIL